MNERIDFAIVTAAREEHEAVLEVFNFSHNHKVSKGSRVYWKKTFKTIDKGDYSIITTQSLEQGSVSDAVLINDLQHHWKPRAIILTGVAASMQKEIQFGDIVIGEEIFYFEAGKTTNKGKLPEPKIFKSSSMLINHIRNVPRKNFPRIINPENNKRKVPNIHFGTILSVNQVIADKVIRDSYLQEHRKLIALEMESYGFAQANWESSLNTQIIVIKAIMDKANSKKDDLWKKQAALCSARFTRSFIKNTPIPCENIEDNKKKERKKERKNKKPILLDWTLIKQFASEITERQIGKYLSEFNPQLNYPRQVINHDYSEFLKSDKNCLVLIGESGIGKSHFILEKVKNIKDYEGLSVIAYRAKNLSGDESIVQKITKDFNQFQQLKNLQLNKTCDIILDINRINETEKHCLLIIIDAINENLEPKRLLELINLFICNYGISCKWLKVIISCRHETWRTIRRGLDLDKNYYFQSKIPADDIGILFDRFNEEEAKLAYQKYKEVLNLTTPWNLIPLRTRDMLRHPFYMWLLAEAHIPIEEIINPNQIYPRFIEALLRTNRVEYTDIHFLKYDLLPLMINKSECTNRISSSILAITPERNSNITLDEFIMNEEKKSSGRGFNQSFLNLSNAKIINKQELGLTYNIEFKYEGFFDYFGGERLFELYKDNSVDEKSHIYKDLISQMGSYTFLWGILKRALQLELQNYHDFQLIKSLCSSVDILGQNLIVRVLSEFEDDLLISEISIFLKELLEVSKEKPIENQQITANIAVRTASNLGLIEILHKASKSVSVSVQVLAALQTFYLWQCNPEKGFQVLSLVAGDIANKIGIPRSKPFLFCLSISLLMLMKQKQDVQKLIQLQIIWKNIIDKNRIFIDRLLPVLLKRYLHKSEIEDEAPDYLILPNTEFSRLKFIKWKFPTSLAEFATFFDLSFERKAIFSALIPYIDSNSTNISEAKNLLLQIANHRDMLSVFLMSFIFLAHFKKSPRTTFEIIRLVFNVAIEEEIVGPSIPYLRLLFFAFSRMQQSFNQEMAIQSFEMVKRAYLKTNGYFQTGRGVLYNRVDLFRSALSYKKVIGNIPEFLLIFLSENISCKKLNMDLLEREIRLIADYEIDNKWRDDGFEILEIVLKMANENLNKQEIAKVKTQVIDTLALLWSYYSDDVEDFVIRNNFSKKELIEIRNGQSESLGDLIGRYSAIFIQEAITFDSFPNLNKEIMILFENAVESKSAVKWFNFVLKWFVNQIYQNKSFSLE